MNLPHEKYTGATLEVSNLEEAALLLVNGYDAKSASINPRGYVTLTFPEEALAILNEYRHKDVAISSLRQFSRAHKTLRTIISQLRNSEAKGISHVEQPRRSC